MIRVQLPKSGLRGTKLPWRDNPFRLISWLEMNEFSAARFTTISRALAEMAAFAESMERLQISAEDPFSIFRIFAEEAALDCDSIGLRITSSALLRLSRVSLNSTAERVSIVLGEINHIFSDELGQHLFFWVPPLRAEWYSKDAASIVGEECRTRFPSIQREIEEAAKCFTVGRYTSSAFHLSRATEAGMQAIARAIGFIPPNNNWNLVFRKLGDEFKVVQAQPQGQWPSHWQTHRAFLETAWADLRAVSKAWRNDIAHLVDIYTEDEAKEFLAVIPLFLREMATKMDETGKLY